MLMSERRGPAQKTLKQQAAGLAPNYCFFLLMRVLLDGEFSSRPWQVTTEATKRGPHKASAAAED